jgi:hypothetical protein
MRKDLNVTRVNDCYGVGIEHLSGGSVKNIGGFFVNMVMFNKR